MASSRMPRPLAWVARVWRSWWGQARRPQLRPMRPATRPVW
jgi:hypothetical protein